MSQKPTAMVVQKQPLWLRTFHWFNLIAFLVMVWSGLLIYWAHDAYRIGWGSWTLFKFFPTGFYKTLGLESRLAEGISWHFLFMGWFVLNGILYGAMLIRSKSYTHFLPYKGVFKDALGVALHDMKLRKEAPPKKGKFNAAQRLAYASALVMGAGLVISGVAIWKPVQAVGITQLLGGYPFARVVHFTCMLGLLGFMLIHVVQVIRDGWNTLRGMITGSTLEVSDES